MTTTLTLEKNQTPKKTETVELNPISKVIDKQGEKIAKQIQKAQENSPDKKLPLTAKKMPKIEKKLSKKLEKADPCVVSLGGTNVFIDIPGKQVTQKKVEDFPSFKDFAVAVKNLLPENTPVVFNLAIAFQPKEQINGLPDGQINPTETQSLQKKFGDFAKDMPTNQSLVEYFQSIFGQNRELIIINDTVATISASQGLMTQGNPEESTVSLIAGTGRNLGFLEKTENETQIVVTGIGRLPGSLFQELATDLKLIENEFTDLIQDYIGGVKESARANSDLTSGDGIGKLLTYLKNEAKTWFLETKGEIFRDLIDPDSSPNQKKSQDLDSKYTSQVNSFLLKFKLELLKKDRLESINLIDFGNIKKYLHLAIAESLNRFLAINFASEIWAFYLLQVEKKPTISRIVVGLEGGVFQNTRLITEIQKLINQVAIEKQVSVTFDLNILKNPQIDGAKAYYQTLTQE